MSNTSNSDTISATPEGLAKALHKKNNLPKPGNPNKKGWSNQDLADKAGVSIDTVKRFFNRTPIKRSFIAWIVEALELEITEIVNPDEWNSPPPPDAINWREVCGTMLKLRRELASNLLTSGMGITIELDDIHVPLGLLERQQKPQCRDESPERGSQAYRQETITPIAYDEFFNNVLAKGQSPKSKGKRLTIIGEPGAGKTTQLLKIADWLLDNSPSETETQWVKPFPIWISLAQVKKPLHQYLREDWLREAAEKLDSAPPAWVKEFTQLLKEGKVWLLLDGADEMGIADPLGTLAQSLRDPLFKNVPVVISCRLNVWEAAGNALSDFDSYKMLDFSYGEGSNSDQVKQFIDKWFNTSSSTRSSAEKIEGNQLRAALDEPGKERIKDLARNPLRLSLLCFTWQFRQGKLSETKAELYQVFVEALYELKKGIFSTTPAQRQKLNAALGQLALKAIEGGYKSILPHSLVSEALEKLHPELYEQALTLGWLNRVGVDSQNPLKCVYAFYHPTFQEYFAACEIEDWRFFLNPIPGNIERDNYRILERQWKEVFLLWLGREEVPGEQKEELITSLVEFKEGGDDFYEYQAYFLAAAGVTEFRQCSRSEEIVRQIVKWGFGYFNIEKQEWRTFLDPIAEAAREVLPQTQRSKAISALVELIGNCRDEKTRGWVAESLGKIEPGNETAVRALVELIGNCGDEDTRIQAAYILSEIGTSNERAISALVELIGNCGDKKTRIMAAYSLGNIDPGNETAIRALVELIVNCGDEKTRYFAAGSLVKIGTSNETAISALVELIGNCGDEDTRSFAAYILTEIGTGNETAIRALVETIGNCGDVDTRIEAASSLVKIGTSNETAIRALVELIGNCGDEDTRSFAAYILAEIGTGNETAIRALVELIGNCGDVATRIQAADSLGKIDPGNEKAIRALVELIGNCGDVATRSRAADSLGKIDPGNETAIRALVELIVNCGDEKTRYFAAGSLVKIGTDNETAIGALAELIGTCGDVETRSRAADSLKKILVTEQQMAGVVYGLKDYLSNETYENDFDRFKQCYEFIWHCAQNLSYPDFYQAWHRQPPTHPKMQDITAAGNTPKTQRLNLETLPQILTTATNNNPDLYGKIKLICIDGSKFLDPDNPASEIYDFMLDLGCAERQNGEPATMQALKLYWNAIRRKSNQLPVWIFYEDPSAPKPQGFSGIFLNALSKFDGAICVVTDPPQPACLQEKTLRWFDATEPDLIGKILVWIGVIL